MVLIFAVTDLNRKGRCHVAKNTDWKVPHSDFGNTPMKDFRDPVSGKRLNSVGDGRPQREIDAGNTSLADKLGTQITKTPRGLVGGSDGST
jgi:hypothetical protein